MTDLSDMAERFKRDTEHHEMTVLRDDGLYRHLRFRQPAPGYSEYWYDLITWPNVLVIRGDMETFAFSRVEDMFEFFRGGRPNPGYWAEKLLAPKSADVKEYSEEKFRQHVFEAFSDAVRGGYAPPGLAGAMRKEVLGSDGAGFEDGAHQVLREFEHGTTFTAGCTCGREVSEPAEWMADSWRTTHARTGHVVSPVSRNEGFRFHDTWEWDLTDWSYQYLWCCHAIQLGIGLYGKVSAEFEAAAYAEKREREQAP